MQNLVKIKNDLIILLIGLVGIVSNASALSCGDVIMTDTVMTEDLYCPWTAAPGLFALEFGNDNVTLDMKGHTITGEDGIGSNIKIGIISHQNITIKNGSIFDSAFAIDVLNSKNIYIQNITFYNISFMGAYISDSTNVFIENSDFYYVDTGIHIYNNSVLTSAHTISNNQFYKNSTAIALYKSKKNKIKGNFVWKSSYIGVSLDESNNNLINKNDIIDTGSTALSLTNSSGNSISSNNLDSNNTGLAILANSDSCYGCDSKYNSFNYNYSINNKIGIDLGGLPGPGVVSYNTLKGNKIYDNETGIYFHTDALYNTTSNGFQGTATPIIDEGIGNTY